MKKLNLLFALLLAFITFTCTSGDDSSQEPENTIRVYKKSEAFINGTLTFDKTVNYNSDKRIQSIVTNDYGYNTETITVSYTGNTITSISEADNFDNPNDTDQTVTYDVTIEANTITLTSQDYEIEINHSNGYVNSTIETDLSNSTILGEQIFTRDSGLNLISNTAGDGSTFTYENFDVDKEIDPFGSVTEYSFSDYFKIFDLKVTANNPTTATYTQGNDTDTYSEFLEYDNQGFVIRTTSEPNSTTNYIEHQYIEL
jgi:hypothetical protein